jgi:hypothetical protein
MYALGGCRLLLPPVASPGHPVRRWTSLGGKSDAHMGASVY